MSTVGIDAIAFYVPRIYVPISSLAEAREIPSEKLEKGLGLKKMAVPDFGEDAATFAANALLKLIDTYNLDPREIGRVYLGTESAIDGSKPTATYAVEIVENKLEAKYGKRCFKHCDILDMTFACVGAVDALHNSVDWVKHHPSRKAVVIASDLSKYSLNSTGEYTQGAGAVAVLISHDPAILTIADSWGIASKSEGDFFKPRRLFSKTELIQSVFTEMGIDCSREKMEAFFKSSNSSFWADDNAIVEVFKEEPVFDGQFSNACYEDRITEALSHFYEQQPRDFLTEWSKIIFHLPYAYHGRRIIFNNWLQWIRKSNDIKLLEKEIGEEPESHKKDWLKRAYKSEFYQNFITEKIAQGELASSEIGNMYTASIFMSFLSIISDALINKEDLDNTRFGFIAYGSGSKSKVFEGTIISGWQGKIKDIELFENLNKRTAIDISTYEKLHKSEISEPILTDDTISLNYIEKEAHNYGLRRYKIN